MFREFTAIFSRKCLFLQEYCNQNSEEMAKEGEEIKNKENERVANCDPLPISGIQSLIKNIRGQQVILDSDLAKLYQVETKRLNEQVKRNIERFPDDFMFQLKAEECSRSHFATLNGKRGQNIKYLPYAFTEQGISMLSGILRSCATSRLQNLLSESKSNVCGKLK